MSGKARLYLLPLPRPYTAAVLEHGCRLVHYREKNIHREKRKYGPQGDFISAHPPPEAVGSWVALVAGADYDTALARWVSARLGLHLPGPDDCKPNLVMGFARLADVTTIAHGPRDPWWMSGDLGATVGCWLEDVRECEPLEYQAPPVAQLVTDPGWLVDLRCRFTEAPLWLQERQRIAQG